MTSENVLPHLGQKLKYLKQKKEKYLKQPLKIKFLSLIVKKFKIPNCHFYVLPKFNTVNYLQFLEEMSFSHIFVHLRDGTVLA
jgi:hypothetical protein